MLPLECDERPQQHAAVSRRVRVEAHSVGVPLDKGGAACVCNGVPTTALAEEQVELNSTNTTISLSNGRVYNGEELSIVVTYNDGTQDVPLTVDIDYELFIIKPAQIKTVGTYNAAIVGKGSYTGNVLHRVRAVAGSAEGAWSTSSRRWLKSVSSLKTASGKAKGSTKVTWKINKEANSGYRVFVYSKKGGNKVLATKVVKAGTGSATIRGLKSGKKYYVCVRPFRTKSGVKYAGVLTGYRAVKAK